MGFDGRAGEIRFFKSSALAGGGISTHALSLTMVCDYLKNRMVSVNVAVIGIQPQTLSMGKKMSVAVRRAVEDLAGELVKKFPA
jgi:hydrogenase maturation protease